MGQPRPNRRGEAIAKIWAKRFVGMLREHVYQLYRDSRLNPQPNTAVLSYNDKGEHIGTALTYRKENDGAPQDKETKTS